MTIKIVITHDYFLTEAHHARLRALGDLEVHKTSTYEEAIQRSQGAAVVLGDCFDVSWDAALLAQLPDLKMLQVNSTGYDGVDVAKAKVLNIKVANVPGFGTEAVAEQAFALLMAVTRRLVPAVEAFRKAPFEASPFNADHLRFQGVNLHEKTMGIIGLGAIGSHVARIAKGYGMKVMAYTRTPKTIESVESVALTTLLSEADVISVNTPLNAESKNIINSEALRLVKPSVIIINTARGECVNSEDLASALSEGRVWGAGLDVLDDLSPVNPLLGRENVVITPHTGYSTKEATAAIPDIMIGNVEAFLAGRPVNLVA